MLLNCKPGTNHNGSREVVQMSVFNPQDIGQLFLIVKEKENKGKEYYRLVHLSSNKVVEAGNNEAWLDL